MTDKPAIIIDFLNALLSMNKIAAHEIIRQIYDDDANFALVEEVIIETLKLLGDGWEDGEYALAQIYMGGIICEEIIMLNLPKETNLQKSVFKLGIGVFMDHHNLGKRIVTSVIRSSGYEIMDFGHGLSVDELVRKTIESDIDVLLISTLMLPSALKIRLFKDKIDELGKHIKIIVGGAPFRLDPELWKKVGADADGKNATDIVSIIESVVNDNHDR